MINVLNILKVVVSLIPAVIEAVKKVEEAIPTSGVGAQKLELIRAILENAFKFGTDSLVKFENVWPILVGIIGSVVSIFNIKGIFKKGGGVAEPTDPLAPVDPAAPVAPIATP